ncbi:DoxX family protein [Pseudomonas sp. LS1212]|uniref:DoxX family protein n=1 Tax=Pseudomonas sp. LS1212 TaxID=2972478 RepID=UPI00215D416C|nr:DoxX family protein [Pseudomonas sp. LS1212]UVJ45746.1 DoxX family protein [Pseudomonas sp. LS1212]
MSPKPVSWFLNSSTSAIVARTLLTVMFLASGLAKLFDFEGAMAEMAHFGLAPAGPIAAAVVFVQLGGSALVILGRHVWLGAGALAVFTLLTIPIAHAFWSMSGEEAFVQKLWVLEHLSIVGALMGVAILHERRALSSSPVSSKGATDAT